MDKQKRDVLLKVITITAAIIVGIHMLYLLLGCINDFSSLWNYNRISFRIYSILNPVCIIINIITFIIIIIGVVKNSESGRMLAIKAVIIYTAVNLCENLVMLFILDMEITEVVSVIAMMIPNMLIIATLWAYIKKMINEYMTSILIIAFNIAFIVFELVRFIKIADGVENFLVNVGFRIVFVVMYISLVNYKNTTL